MMNDPIDPRSARGSKNIYGWLIGLIIVALIVWWYAMRTPAG